MKNTFKDLHIKKAYSSDNDDILDDFYIPVLENSIKYCRLAGYFSSTSLALAARGVAGLIKNNGIMMLIVSPILKEEDLDIVKQYDNDPRMFLGEKMIKEIDEIENEFVKDHLFALGWMLANNKLEIKIAIAYDNNRILSDTTINQIGIFHQKVGILWDKEDNIISFSGSINESAVGWLENVEEFKVFRSWEPIENEYIKIDINKFNTFWFNQSPKVKIFELPEALRKKLIQIAPSNIDELNLIRLSLKKKKRIKLFHQQEEAINLWVSKGMKGILEMATGTGKTYTALGCLKKVYERNDKLLVIITCPYQHLIQQWKREIDEFGIDYDDIVIAESSNYIWKKSLIDKILEMQIGYKKKIIILTTHRTFSSKNFINIINQNKSDIEILLIADEVHGLGAKKSMEGLIPVYKFRIGLSATPKRWFDNMGTKKILDYFGDVIFEFPLEKAINTLNPLTNETYLTPYRYIPKFLSLTTEEIEDYYIKTKLIIKLINNTNNEIDKLEQLENLLYIRANIIKNAINKYNVLEEILDELGSSIEWTIIYCSPQQIERVKKIISSRHITFHGFTMKESVIPEKKYGNISERDYILKNFAECKYKVLVAIKCLDEGVNIPQARNAILMASSGNPREYIQRIGRIIRRYPQKKEAVIYDLIVTPAFDIIPPELREIEKKIFKKEMERSLYIAKIAINNAETAKEIYNKLY